MTIELPFLHQLSPVNRLSLWRQEYREWTEQIRLLKAFERECIFCSACTEADERLHRSSVAALLAKGEELSLQLDELAVEPGERSKAAETIATFLEDFRDTLMSYWVPRDPADQRLAVLGM